VVLLQKVIGYRYPFDRELYATTSKLAISLGELHFKLIKRWPDKKSFYHPRSTSMSRPIQSYHFQSDLIWCVGTFEIRLHLRNMNIEQPKQTFPMIYYLIDEDFILICPMGVFSLPLYMINKPQV
jgi:hypothetical protein